MTVFQSFLLGILQGLTEFIPVSSTAHLLIAQKLLGIPSSDAVFSFLVIVQLGTILSLLVFFWKDLVKVIAAVLASLKPLITRRPGRVSAEARLGWHILIATLPALLAGYLLREVVQALFKTPLLEASIRLLAAALLLTLAEVFSKRSRNLEAMTWLDALVIGLFQVVAIFPGASRSGTTISAGMLRGFERRSAARFAFLMSVPVMLAAGGFEMLDVLRMQQLGSFLPPLVVGFLIAALVGWLAVKWLLNYLDRHSLYPFAGYCALTGVACLVLNLVG